MDHEHIEVFLRWPWQARCVGLTTLALIRHGQSVSNAEGRIAGTRTLSTLTDEGRLATLALRDRLLRIWDREPSIVVSSPMPWAQETAALLMQELGSPVITHVGIREQDPGMAEGLSVDEYRNRYRREPWATWDEPLSPGGETNAAFHARVGSALDEILVDTLGRRLWLITHSGVVMASARILMQTPSGDAAPAWRYPAHTAISMWSRTNGQPWRLERYNDQRHLLPDSFSELQRHS